MYEWVLKEKARIEISIWDTGKWRPEEVDRRFFAPVIRFDDFIMARSRRDIQNLERKIGFKIHSLNDLLKGLEILFEKVSKYVIGIKIGIAYVRSLSFKNRLSVKLKRSSIECLKK